MSVEVKLTCLCCRKTTTVKPVLLLTKFGVLRVEGFADGFYVNGYGAYCPDHIPSDALRTDNETWSEYDRANVVRDLIEEGQPKVVDPDERARRIAEALS